MKKASFQIVYSVSILVIIPILLVVNTIFMATSVRNNYDKELQSRAELANSVLAISVQDYLEFGQDDLANSKLQKLKETQKELRNMAIITKTSSGYKVFATADDNFELSNSDSLQYDIVFGRKWPVAKNILAYTDKGQKTRAWNVATPIIDDNDNVIGVVTSEFLTTDIDERFDATIARSFWIMIGSTLAVLFLLVNHFRYIGYVGMLQKQKELNQTMNDFLSVASHELKAPMTIIKGYISNVTDGDFGEIPDQAKEQLNVAVVQTERLNELVLDLLNVSHIEQGKIEINMAPIDVTGIIREIVSSYTDKAKEKGLSIEYKPEHEQNFIMADAGRVREVFTNLIDNAVKYSIEGSIVVSHEKSGKYLITSVRDTGIGMSTEDRSRLFQRFYRVKNDKTKDISGTGLGLWIIKQYIEKMGGKISVDSLVGSGTEFRVSLKAGEAVGVSEISD